MAGTGATLALQQPIWGLHDTALVPGVHLMWRRGELHSVAAVAFNPGWEDPAYAVPMLQWSFMRMTSDRFNIPSSAYIEGDPGSVYCANWPVQSGLGYRCEEDSKLGGLVVIPRTEFKLVEKKT
jgi:hypothetical protein